MKKIEITLDIENACYSIEELFSANCYQGIRTDDLEEALLYIDRLLEDLNDED